MGLVERQALVHVFDQILEGYDIPTPAGMLRVRGDAAAAKVDPAPYSLLVNVAHAAMWQDFWLRKLAGGRRKSTMEEWSKDWRVPDPDEWPEVRKRFVDGLTEARRIAAAEPFEHRLPTDQEAIETLVRIAVHGAYHLGQMNLLKRMSKAKA